MKKKLFAIILCLVMILSSVSILSEVSFAVGKTFTVIKGSDVVGEYDKFYDAIGAMDSSDKTTRYTITVNKDAVIPASQRGGYYRTNNKFRITSSAGGPYKLTREGVWGILGIQTDAELTVDNITLDGSGTCQCFFISNNGIVTIGDRATIQNFVDTPDTTNESGPAIHMIDSSTLNIEEGATIQNNTSNTQGGVIQAYNGTTVNISGGTFKNNKSNTSDGGAIAAYGNLNITGGTFEGNEAKRTGGALIVGQRATASISNATFKNNKASTSGAIYSSKDLTVTKTSFEANEANWAGAIYANKALTLSENTFSKNTSKNAGGALYLSSGGSNITDCTFEENIAETQGGAIYIKAGDTSIVKTEFTKNLAGTGGGAIFVNHNNNGTTSVEKATFTQNASNAFGGGIYLGKNAKLDLKTSAFKKNEAAFGAGLASAGEGSPDANTNNIKVEATSFTENLALLGGGIITAFPTEITNCTFTKNKAVVHPQDDQKNPHSSGVGGAVEILDNKIIIKSTTFTENWAFGSGGALGLSGVKRGQDDKIVGIKDNLKVEISDNTKFIGNTSEKGQGGAIFTIPYLYDIHGYKSDIDEDELKAKAYQNITTSDNTVFKNNIAKLGYSNPPENYNIYTKLEFQENSFTQTQPSKDLAKSLLNNYDINYMVNNIVVPEANITLTLDENHAHGKITDYDVMKGEAIDPYLYTPHRKGYIFRGWSYNRDFLDEVRKGDIVYGDTVLYAIWKKDKAKDEVAEPEEIKGQEHKAYIFGYTDGTVRPNGEITRAEAAAMLARLLEIESIGSADKPNFPDTPSAWYNKAINAVVQRGIMKGYPDGTFKPNDAITRAEFTQMISTIDNKPYGTAPFADVIGHWAERPIGSEYQAGRIAGYPDGTFRPDSHITRCEVAVILNKIFERNFDNMSLLKCKNPQMIKYFIDLDASFWGYNDLIEATNTHEYVRRVKGRVEENWLLIK